MASFQTFFRTIIMLATLGFVAKLWFLYGPSASEVKSITVRAVELGEQAWNNYWQPSESGPPLADAPPAANVGSPAPFAPPTEPMQPIPVGPATRSMPGQPGSVQLVGDTTQPLNPTSPPTAPALVPMSTPNIDDGVNVFLQRLGELGVRDLELGPWGSGGQLYRFSCNVPWGDSPGFNRHFEAVAGTPLAAVQEVSAEIDAWRNSRQQSAAATR